MGAHMMLGMPIRYFFKHPILTTAEIAADPLQLWLTIRDEYAGVRESRRPKCAYQADGEWERRLHESLGVPWPCEETAPFWTLWSRVISELEAKRIRP